MKTKTNLQSFKSGAFFAAIFCSIMMSSGASAQLTGTKNIPGDYATLADAITDLNAQGVGAGGVTLNLLAGNSETAPVGGYVVGGVGSMVLTTTSAANPVIIQGNGNTLTANAGLVAGALNDAIIKLVGADFITITGFIMQENPANANSTPATNNMTEWGVALLHVSPTDGCQNNTIQGNTISLVRTYTNTFGVYSNNRHSATDVLTVEDITNNTTAPNSGNKVYNNNISNVNMGVTMIGSAVAANMDIGNDVGGAALATGNTVTNWGGAAAGSAFVSNVATSYCMYMNHQVGVNVSFNSVTSAAVSFSGTFLGIYVEYATTSPTGAFVNNVNSNTVTMTNSFVSATATQIQCIRHSNAAATANASATVNMNSNTVLNCAVTGVPAPTVALTVFGVLNTANFGTANLNSNIVQGTTSTATTGGIVGVTSQGAVVNTVNLNNNQCGNAGGNFITFSNATTSASPVNAVTCSTAAATANVSISNNDIRGVVYNVASAGGPLFLSNSSTSLSQNISNNTFTNLNLNTTGSVTFIANSISAPTGGSKTISNNSIVTAFNKAGAGGTITLYSDNGSSVAGVIVNNNNNNFSNITVTGATTIAGWSNTDGGQPTKTIQGNTFSNWTGGTSSVTALNLNFGSTATTTATSNTISSINSGGAITGMVLGSSIGTVNASQNTINSLSTTGAAAVQAITSASTTSNLFKNKIYDLQSNSATGTVNGITVSGGTTVTVFNNLIGDLRAPSTSSTTDAIRGINLTSSTSSSNLNIYYNSIYLNAMSSGANFSTSGIFHTTSATATTATLNLRNNVIVNLSTPNGTGFTSAYRRSSTALTNYGSSSNNNDFYAGTPGAARVIFYDGTNSDQTIGAYKTRVAPRDSASLSENPTFLSTTGSSAQFLHIDPTVATQLESGAVNIAGITNDFDMDIRQGNPGYAGSGTAPDIGADEFEGIALDLSPPVISYMPLGGGVVAGTRSFANITVTDASGVNTTAGTRPRVYYKRSTDANTFNDNTSGTDGWKFVEADGAGGSPFTFTIDYSLLNGGSGVAVGNTVQYFVVAQDNAPTPNVGINSGTFTAQPSSVALTAAAFPIGGSINSYMILDTIMGKQTVGVGGVYTTLTAAIADLNNKVLNGPVKFTLTDATYPSETFPIVINANGGSSATNTITIQPGTGVSPTISGSSASAIIVINGADYVIIDGQMTPAPMSRHSAPAPSVPTRDLTITNTSGSTTSAVVWLQTAAGPDGATNNTVKNVNLVGTSNTTTLFGVGSGSSTISTSSLGTGNNNNTFQNNSISKTQFGIYSGGASAANKNTGNVITQNLINAASPDNVQIGGILVKFENGIQITRNSIANISQSSGAFGIGLGLGDSITNLLNIASGSDVTNAVVSRNTIDSVTSTSTTGFSAAGIIINPVTSGVTQVDNNMISRVVSQATPSDSTLGIFAMGGAGSTTKIYFNSVSMTGSRANATNPSYALAIGGSNPIVDVRDNIFSNTQTGTSTGKMYAIGTASSTFTNLTSDYNDLFASGANTFVGQTGGLGTSGTDRATLAAWQLTTGEGVDSISADPLFLSPSNLHITCTSPAADMGTPIAGITTDIDGDPRDTVSPDMGADEIAPPTPVSAVSRKTHGGAGDFDINLPFAGPAGVECRSGGVTNDYEVVVTFASPVTVSSAVVTSGTGSVVSASGSTTNIITVDLTGVADAQYLTFKLLCTDDGVNSGNVAVTMGVLLGDTTENGSVNSGDVSQTKSQLGIPVDGTNFRTDVNVNGSISSSDVSLVKSRIGNGLPP